MVADNFSALDFIITEYGFYYNWIEQFLPFIDADKPVFAAKYNGMDVDFEAAGVWGKQYAVSFILKNRILTVCGGTCP
jgi:hypothetical protein